MYNCSSQVSLTLQSGLVKISILSSLRPRKWALSIVVRSTLSTSIVDCRSQKACLGPSLPMMF